MNLGEHANYTIKAGLLAISDYFSKTLAKDWSIAGYISNSPNVHVTRKVRNGILRDYKSDLDKIMHCAEVPSAVKLFATELKKAAIEPEQNSQHVVNNSGIFYGDVYSFSSNNSAGPSKKRKFKQQSNTAQSNTAHSNTAHSNEHLEQRRTTSKEEEEEEEETNELDTSFSTDLTDESYTYIKERAIMKDHLPNQKCYYLSMSEISNIGDSKLCIMPSDITAEDRYTISFITHSHEIQRAPLIGFTQDFQSILCEFRKAVKFNTIMDLSKIGLLEKNEKLLSCMLMILSESLKKKKEILPMTTTRKFNPDKNGEFNFIVKQVAYLFESIVNCTSLHIEWDVTSNVYKGCELKVQFCRHDFILYANDGLEIGTGEIKPYNANHYAIEIDRCRVAESLKKQLHKRMVYARSETELVTYGAIIYGDQMELNTLTLTTDGVYKYVTIYHATLPTSEKTYTFMEETLEIIMQFVLSAEKSLFTTEQQQQELIMPRFARFLRPTVYMITDEDSE